MLVGFLSSSRRLASQSSKVDTAAMSLHTASRNAFAQTSRRITIRKLQHLQSGSKRCIHNRYSSASAKHQTWTRPSAITLAAAAGLALIYSSSGLHEAHAEAAPPPAELTIEKPKKKKGASKEENRALISSQHLQVKRSWENPGVYAWGSNTGRVAAPDSEEAYVKTPRRIPYFDDVLLRDIKLDRNFGAAVKENGDLVQWGKGYSEENAQPAVTLRGKNLKSIAVSRDRIVGLSKNGSVYSIPVSRMDQESGPKPSEASWIPFWNNRSNISYRRLKPKNLAYSEKVTDISGGLEHVLLLTTAGRVFSAASGSEDFPARGQLGVPGVTWSTRPEGPYDMCHEITTLKGFDVAKVAAGDHHSLVLDKEGRVFSFGDNSCGQLGFDYSPESPSIDAPSLLPMQKLYAGTNQTPRVTSISAGGVNSFFTIDATRVTGPGEKAAEVRGLGRVTADTWSCGQGIKGGLGNGRWTHIQGTPTKIQSLSGLFEYDERKNQVIPIRMARISVGSNHASAVMDNVTYLNASEKSSENDTNWGADVLWWGGNEFYQLGTGKRNNVSNPVYIRPLDMAAEAEAGRKEEHRFHITPRHMVKTGNRKVSMEQRIECGRNVTVVYSGV
jgi:alpha-tubulin suppressor-like RCC1 family protein